MRLRRINIQLDKKIWSLSENASEEAGANLQWWLTTWDGTPCVKQKKCGKRIKLQCQSLKGAGKYYEGGKFMPAPWAWSAQRASGNANFLLGKSQLLCLKPKGKQLVQRCSRQQAVLCWAWKHPPSIHRKSMFWCSIHPLPPPPAPSFSICLTQLPPASGTSHTHQNKVLSPMNPVSVAHMLENVWISCQCGCSQKLSFTLFLHW